MLPFNKDALRACVIASEPNLLEGKDFTLPAAEVHNVKAEEFLSRLYENLEAILPYAKQDLSPPCRTADAVLGSGEQRLTRTEEERDIAKFAVTQAKGNLIEASRIFNFVTEGWGGN